MVESKNAQDAQLLAPVIFMLVAHKRLNLYLGGKVDLIGRLLSQSERPRGWFGRILVRGMNLRHSGLTRWGLSKIEIPEHANVLDIGCGGGRTLEHLASITRLGKAVGIDYSEDSVAVTRKRNQKLIVSGRVEVLHGAVSSMPYENTKECAKRDTA